MLRPRVDTRRKNRRLLIAGAALVVGGLLAAAAGVGLLFMRRPGPDGFARRPENAPVVLAGLNADGPLQVDEVLIESPDGQQVSLALSITAPPEARSMQVSTDPEFVGASWQPVAANAMLPVNNAGYQMIYLRFRTEDDAVIGPVVAGAMVDPTEAAATSSADGVHEPSWVRPLSPTELVVRVEAGRLRLGSIESYDLDNPLDGDRLTWGLLGPKMIHRDGEPYAFPVSERRDLIRRIDVLDGRPLDADRARNESWTISVDGTDAAQAVPVTVVSRPTGGGLDRNGDPLTAVVHDFVLSLPAALEAGAEYVVTPPTDLVAPMAFTFDPTTTLSPAVRVNQVGYGAADGTKLAYLAGWFDGIGAAVATSADRFQLIDNEGRVVFEGPVTPRPTGRDMGERDLTGTPVAEMDFGAVTAAGRYRVCVPSVGCSYDVVIAENPWQQLTSTVARSTYHQRSGVTLGPPYTSFTRPRPYHQDEGLVVVASDYSLLEGNANPETRFDSLVSTATDEEVPQAWGGHFDAGDWDRRIQHLWYARNAAQLVTAFPEHFAGDLNIPESGDDVPDILDEALWSLDFYRRLQLPNGAVRGGVEASEHPPVHSTSWTDDLAVYAFAPDPWSSFIYAGVAAEMAAALRPYAPDRADGYLASAIAAYGWAETQPAGATDQAVIDGQRNVAAAALLVATGEPRWHEAFLETADYLTAGFGDDAMLCHAHTRCDGGWLYMQADEAVTDPTIRAAITTRFVSSAETMLNLANDTAYRWTVEDGNVPLIWGLGPGGAPRTSGLLRAYLLTGDERFRDAAVTSAGYALGANPFNQVLVTGYGKEPVRYPVIVDAQYGGIPVWPGTPVYGHHQLNAIGNDQWAVEFVLNPAGASPSPDQVPFLWQWYDVSTIAFFNEFTVHQSHAEALFSFGVLAATS